jgi:ankyrin repeat protein
MANRSDLSARVSALLDGSQRRGRAGWRLTASVLGVACLVVLALAPVRAAPLSKKQTAALTQTPGSQSDSTGKRDESSAQAPGSQNNTTGLDRALIRAAAEGDISGIDELLRAGANVNCTVDIGEFGSPLSAAAYKGRLDAVRLLLDRGADPNLVSDAGPLINAAEGGHVDIVSLLLDRGAIIDQIVPGNQNALIRASGKGRMEVVKLLVARGADVNARAWAPQSITYKKVNAEGKIVRYTVVKSVVKKDGTRQIVDDPSSKGEWMTPLSIAKRGGHKEVVAFLIASGAQE